MNKKECEIREQNMKSILKKFSVELRDIHKSLRIDIARKDKLGFFSIIAKEKNLFDAVAFLLGQENAVWQNLGEKYDYHWRPSPSYFRYSTDIFLIDDPKENDMSIPYFVIQTSEKKKQYVCVLEKREEIEKVQAFQTALVKKLGGDPGCNHVFHFGRIPGFYSLKYSPPFLCDFSVIPTNILSLPPVVPVHPVQNQEIEKPLERKNKKIKLWEEFVVDDDESRTDFRFALYHLQFIPPKEVAKMLLEQSPQLENRKPKHVEDYLSRTIRKALAILQEKINTEIGRS